VASASPKPRPERLPSHTASRAQPSRVRAARRRMRGAQRAEGERRADYTPTMKLTLVVPLPPMFSVWTFLAPSTW
jgi:hypothetical protein